MAQASRRKASDKSAPKAWKWLLAGVLIGASGGWYTGNKGYIRIEGNKSEADQTKITQNTGQHKQKDKKSTALKFDFYSLLPEMEVEVPVEEIKKAPPKPETAKVETQKQLSAPLASLPGQTNISPQSAPAQSQAQPQPPVQSPANTVYLLQLGSFSSAAEADRLKARLAMQGIETDVQNVTISNSQGKTSVYRVRSGPYSQSEIQSAHKGLQQAGVNGAIIRVK